MKEITLKNAKQIASHIHHKYKEDSKPPTGNQNCQLCTWCAEAQFRGIDVLPRPIYSPRDPALEIKGETIVKSPTKIKLRNKDNIVSDAKNNPGSRYYVHVKWKEGNGGHEFLVISIDSKVYTMDAQQGLVEPIDDSKYFDEVDYSESYFARLDNKELDRALLNKMNSMKTLVEWDWDKDVEYMKKHGMLGEDEDIRFIRYYVPSDKATEYLKKDPELKQYWETLNKETNGEILVDPNTKEQIGYGFVYKSGKNKGFIFNIEVMKKFRRQGFGTIILNDCVTKFGGVDLTVSCDNEGAIKLYLKYGFEIVETVKGQNGRDEYYMKLKKSKTVQEYHSDLSDETFYRFEYDGEGIYEAFRKNVTFDEWKKFKQSNAAKWLPVPPNYQNGDESFFTEKGYKKFMKETYPHMMKHLEESKVRKFECELNPKYIRYRDEYQVVYNKSKTVQEAFIDDRTQPLTKVTNVNFDKVYYGDPINAGKTRTLDGKPLFVSPLKGVASIFSDRRNRIKEEMHKRGYDKFDIGYVEWNLPTDELKNPLTDVHVYIRTYPDIEPFEFEGEGYIHTIDISGLKDNMYRFDWMNPDREILIANVDAVDIESVEKINVRYHVAGTNYYDKSMIQEGVDMITQEFDPLKLYSAINKEKTAYRDKQLNIGDFNRVPLNMATAEEYNEGHGHWVTSLSSYRVNDDDFEGTILVDENGICAGYLVIETRDDTKWVVGVESSMDYKSFAIVEQLLYLARTEYDTTHAVAPKTNKALIECYLDNGWKVSNENPYLVLLKYEDTDDDEEDETEDDHEDVITEYMFAEASSNKLMFHVSDRKNLDGQVFRPRVPEYLDPYDPKDTGFENNTTARVCFAPTIDGALNAITVNVQPTDPVKFDKMYVYIPEKPFNQYKHKTNMELIRDKDVYDANVTGEAWILEPVRLRLYGVIQVDQNRKVKRKKTVPTSENKRGDRNVFSYRWHWLVKPKVISATVGKVKYDAMAVCDMIARELYQFKYGLCVDGRKKTNTTEADWDKYWRLQSPEQFEQSKVGNCYDFVEWEAGFLDAYYVKYKKYYISALYKDKLATHTFIVVPDNGKYIYLEGAFKRVADEIHHMKVFDKLEDIFEYIVECMVEFENVPEFDYGVWDYTDNGIKPGTDMKHFQEDITKGDTIHEGNVKRKKE